MTYESTDGIDTCACPHQYITDCLLEQDHTLADIAKGRITLFPKHTLVDVPEDFAQQAIRNTKNSKLKGKPFRIDLDRGPAA